MSYADEIAKIEQPASAELFHISIGNGTTHQFMTSFDTKVTFLGHDYIPVPINRGAYSFERSLKTVSVTLAFPVSSAFSNYLSSAPFQATVIEIYRVFVDDPDNKYTLLFTGTVNAVQIKDFLANVKCDANNAVLSRKIPKMFYQTTCNWAIFDDSCSVIRDDYREGVLVQTVSGNQLTLNRHFADHVYTGGTVVFGSDERLITKQMDNVIDLLVAFDSSVTPTTPLSLYPGCNGRPETCRGFYDNLTNFCGMPYIPTKNALLWGFR